MFVQLVYNAALLISLSVFYGVFSSLRKKNAVVYRIVIGILFGGITLAAMSMPVHYAPGIIYDGRSVILTLSGLFGGGIVTLVTAIIAAVYRVFIGGSGVYAGILTIVLSSLVGFAFRRYYKNKIEQISLPVLFMVGVITHLFMLAAQLALPWPKGIEVIQNIWVEILIVFPFTTLFIGVLLRSEEKRLLTLDQLIHSKLLFQTLADHSPVGIFRTDPTGKTIYVNPKWSQFSGISSEEAMGDGWFDALYPEDKDRLVEVWSESFKEQKISVAEYRFRRTDGQIIWVYGEAVPEISEDGEILGYIGTLTDISERKKFEEAIIQSEENFRRSLNESPFGVRIIGMDGETIYVNKALLEISGLETPEEFFNFQFSSMYDQESYRMHEIRKQQRIRNEFVALNYEIKITNKKGQEKYLLVIRKEIYWNNSPCLQIFYRDITERKIVEKALKESEQNYRSLFENHAAVKLIIDVEDGRILAANHAAADFYGWSIDQLITMNIRDINMLSSGDLAEAINKALKRETLFFEFVHQLANGEKRNVEVFTSNSRFQGRECLHSIVHDITKKKRVEEKLNLLSQSVEQSPVSIVITDPDGKIEYVNPTFTRLTGYSLAESLGQNPRLLNSGKQSVDFYKGLWDTILSGKNWTGEMWNKKKSGDLYLESVIISPILDANGLITNFIGIKEDVTERKQMLQDLIDAKIKAEENERLKSAFLANMSHEIRTPLNAILGFLQMLFSSDDLSEKQKEEFVSIINHSADSLLQIINDILILSQIETRQLKIDYKIVSLNEMLSEIYFQSKRKMQEDEKGHVELIMNQPSGHLEIRVDRIRLTQILMNLITNAIKFTEQGSISFGVEEISEEFIHFFVRDTGIGIPALQQAGIFDRFRQVDGSLTRTRSGAGLGLSIVRSLVEIMGGEIRLESEVGVGTTFYFSLPI